MDYICAECSQPLEVVSESDKHLWVRHADHSLDLMPGVGGHIAVLRDEQ